MLKLYNLLFYLVLFSLAIANGCGGSRNLSQSEETEVVEMSGVNPDQDDMKPRFYADPVNVASTDTTRKKATLLISLVAPLEDLTFATYHSGDSSLFRAVINWEVKVSFNSPVSGLEVSDTRFIQKEIIVQTYEETRRSITVAKAVFYLTANASYSLDVVLSDTETKKSHRKIYKPIGARYLSAQEFSLADPVLFLFANVDSAGVSFVPLNSQRVDPWQQIPFLTIIYNPPKGQTIQMLYQLWNDKNKTLLEFKQAVNPTQEDWAYDTLFVNLPEEAGNGLYALTASATSENGTTAFLSANRSFRIHSIIPRNAKELDEAVRQMTCIPETERIIKNVLEAKTFREKRLLWLDFWKQIDPQPERAAAIMKEFYRRVAYANTHFRSQIKNGWQTDRGRVYIRFGPPENVDRRSFELNSKPSEIWHYYRLRARDDIYIREQYKFFIFINNFGIEYEFAENGIHDDKIYNHNVVEYEDR